MRISDWSSDVCSSDLPHVRRAALRKKCVVEAYPLTSAGQAFNRIAWEIDKRTRTEAFAFTANSFFEGENARAACHKVGRRSRLFAGARLPPVFTNAGGDAPGPCPPARVEWPRPCQHGAGGGRSGSER